MYRTIYSNSNTGYAIILYTLPVNEEAGQKTAVGRRIITRMAII
jgi:hypothetical protein